VKRRIAAKIAKSVRETGAVFAVFAGHYQRRIAPSLQESRAIGGATNERTAGSTAGAE
jgi:hypothetical protein